LSSYGNVNEGFVRLEIERNKFIAEIMKVETSVKEKGDEIKRLVDSQVNELLQELQLIKSDNLKEMETLKEKFELGLQAMESFTKYSMDLKHLARPCYISRDVNALHARAEELLVTCNLPSGVQGTLVSLTPLNSHEYSESSGHNLVGKIEISKYKGEHMAYITLLTNMIFLTTS
jgi:hypothetical protein